MVEGREGIGAGMEAGIQTLCMTDMENSTPLLQQWPDDWPNILAAHRRLILEAITAHGGVEVSALGEEICASFPTSTQAIAGAIRAQQLLAYHEFDHGVEVRVRIGIHTGRPLVTAEGLVGLDVHRAARIRSAGYGGQILISEPTRSSFDELANPDVEFVDLGLHRMKGLGQPEHLFQVCAPGLPRHFPPVRTLSGRPVGLPVPPNPLIGREAERRELHNLIGRAEVRLITLIGPGGVGKTRLALEVAAQSNLRFVDGVRFIPLETVREPAGVIGAICTAFDLPVGAGESLLVDELYEKNALLLIDNFEHVSEAAGDIAALLANCPAIKILTTSREPLWLRGEHGFRVEPLRVPTGPAALRSVNATPAVQLFVQRAGDVRPGFMITEQNAQAVSAICQRLDGMPLAIELVAARTRLFSPERVLERLNTTRDFASGGQRDLPTRHQSLSAAISWSYELLPEEEREVFRRVAIYRGPFTAEMAAAVLPADFGDTGMADRLESLNARSLLRLHDTSGDDPAFTMLRTIREFALERLAEMHEYDDTAQRHLSWLRGWALALDRSQDRARLVSELARCWDDLRQALAFSLGTPERAVMGLSMAVAMGTLYWQRAPGEGWTWFDQLLKAARGAPPQIRARALRWYALLGMPVRPADENVRVAEECVAVAREAHDRSVVTILALNILGQTLVPAGQPQRALEACSEAVDLAIALGDPSLIGLVHGPYGMALFAAGDMEGARRAWTRSIEEFTRTGDDLVVTSPMCWLTNLEIRAGELEAAERMGFRAITILQRTGDVPRMSEAYSHLARVRLAQRDMVDARNFLLEALVSARVPAGLDSPESPSPAWALTATAEFLGALGATEGAVVMVEAARTAAVGLSGRVVERPEIDALLARAREELLTDHFDAAASRGRAMTTPQAITFALEVLGSDR